MLSNFMFEINGNTLETLYTSVFVKYVAFDTNTLAKLSTILKSNPIVADAAGLSHKGVIWDGLHDFILLIMKIYQLRLYDINEFEDDLGKELKRMKSIRKKTPYVRDYPRKLKYPE